MATRPLQVGAFPLRYRLASIVLRGAQFFAVGCFASTLGHSLTIHLVSFSRLSLLLWNPLSSSLCVACGGVLETVLASAGHQPVFPGCLLFHSRLSIMGLPSISGSLYDCCISSLIS